jgi:hypothetical protein
MLLMLRLVLMPLTLSLLLRLVLVLKAAASKELLLRKLQDKDNSIQINIERDIVASFT